MMSANTRPPAGAPGQPRRSALRYRPGQLSAGAARALLAPVMQAWYRRSLGLIGSVPRPDGWTAHACGPRPARVLLVGGAGPVIGWGVRSHDLALAGQLARVLAAATGRGIDVDVLADPELPLAGIPARLAGQDLDVDAVVVATGVREAVLLRSPRAWHRDLAVLIEALRTSRPAPARILVAGIHPIRSIAILQTPVLGRLADRHAERLNGLSRDMCEDEPGVAFAAMPAPTDPCEGRHRSPVSFLQWAEVIAPALADGIAGPAGRAALGSDTSEPDAVPLERPAPDAAHGGGAPCGSDRCPGHLVEAGGLPLPG